MIATRRAGCCFWPGLTLALLLLSLMLVVHVIGSPAPPSTSGGARPTTADPGGISVTVLGAKGNGLADDRPAIQAAMDAGHARGMPVYFPAGSYLLGTASQPEDRILRTYPGQHLVGEGSATSTLVVAPHFGRYVTVLGAQSDQTDIGRWSLTGLTIDQNGPAGNQVDVTGLHSYPRMAIRVGSYAAGSRIKIDRCGLRAASSLNGFYLFAQDLQVSSCLFDGIGGTAGSPVHDHSTVYTSTVVANGTQVIRDNVFIGVAGAGGARSAIDTHGGHQSIQNNVIRDYLRGMNVTGMGRTATPRARIEHNTILNAEIGIELWVRRRPDAGAGPELAQVLVRDNAMSLRGSAWRLQGLQPHTRGVVTNARNDEAVARIVIESNVVSNTDLLDPDHRVVAVDCSNQRRRVGVDDVTITGNVFRGHWTAIIDTSCFSSHAAISGNTVRP